MLYGGLGLGANEGASADLAAAREVDLHPPSRPQRVEAGEESCFQQAAQRPRPRIVLGGEWLHAVRPWLASPRPWLLRGARRSPLDRAHHLITAAPDFDSTAH